LAVTSNLGNRGRALGVVFALTMVGALLSAQTAFGAVDGDPIGTVTVFKVKLSSGFKKQLKHNGVKMKPKSIKLTKGDVDPTTGAADLTLGKITFKKGNKKLVYSNIKGSEPGTLKSSSSGKLFKATAATTVTRQGFGADVSGVQLKLLKSAAKKINKTLGLHSLHKGGVGSLTLSYQPQTVKVLSGRADVTPALSGSSVASKLLAHCIPLVGGVVAVQGATQDNPPIGDFHFPVAGGTISPVGTDGVVNQVGGLMLHNASTGAGLGPECTNAGGVKDAGNAGGSIIASSITQRNFATNLLLSNIQANVLLGGGPPGGLGGPLADPKDIGQAIAATIDNAGPPVAKVTADPAKHTITVGGGVIKITDSSAQFLNLFFPQPTATNNPARQFAANDLFGFPTMTVTTR
jgi:hypothetical protein